MVREKLVRVDFKSMFDRARIYGFHKGTDRFGNVKFKPTSHFTIVWAAFTRGNSILDAILGYKKEMVLSQSNIVGWKHKLGEIITIHKDTWERMYEVELKEETDLIKADKEVEGRVDFVKFTGNLM